MAGRWSGKDYDDRNPQYTPNKDRRLAEWRKKKDAEKAARDEANRAELEKRGKEEAEKASEKEERNEGKSVSNEPISSDDDTLINAIENGSMGSPEVTPRRRNRRAHFDQSPTLFDEVE